MLFKCFQIEVHKRAMSISPPSVEGHNLLGFALALNSNYSDAADEFQAAKSFDRHNQFAEEMLKHVMTEIAKECFRLIHQKYLIIYIIRDRRTGHGSRIFL